MSESPTILYEFFERLSEQDYERLTPLLAEDIEFEVAYMPANSGLLNPVRGRDAVMDMFQSTVKAMFADMRYTISTLYEVTDGESVIVEYTSVATARPTGRPYQNSYAGVFRLKDGKVSFWREYHNPERMIEAFGTADAS